MSDGRPHRPLDDGPDRPWGERDPRPAAGADAGAGGDGLSVTPSQDAAHLLDELRIHQIELEMQNAELRRAQVELEASRGKYFELFDNAPVGYLLLDARGIVKDVNIAAARLLGSDRSQLTGRVFFTLVLPADRDAYRAMVRRSEEHDSAETCEVRLLRAAPSSTRQSDQEPATLWAALEGRPCQWDGAPGGLLLVFTDVSDRKSDEREIQRLTEELRGRVATTIGERDALDRELEAYGYSIAHDVRTPLRAIDGFSAVILEEEGLSAEGRDALHRVRLAVQRLGRLLDGLMGLSRISRQDVQRRPVDVTALAEEVGREIAADHTGRTVDYAVQPGMSCDADEQLLRLILRELLDNAWKFTTSNASAQVRVGLLEQDGGHAFFVRDDGAGFDVRHAEHLFGAFQRMHGSDEFPGSGIGLATVQRLVRMHGGRIWAEAGVEEGATFFFTLGEDSPLTPSGES